MGRNSTKGSMARLLPLLALSAGWFVTGLGAEPPAVEGYLHRGELAKGEQALIRILDAQPADDQARFGLGFLQVIRGVERLGQALHEHGVSPKTEIPFLRIPVPANPEPVPVTYLEVRRFLGAFQRDLDEAERTLAAIRDDRVKLELRLAEIQLDLTGDGVPDDRLVGVLDKVLGGARRPAFLRDNPSFKVAFDRGDVAWLRAYCNLLSGMLDGVLALDLEEWFDAHAAELFAKPKVRPGKARSRPRISVNKQVRVVEPARFGRLRKKLLAVTELNQETWRFLRAETDDDHEWLPNARQRGEFGMPVSDARIDVWLAMMAELRPALEGKRTLRAFAAVRNDGKELNFRALLDDPPEKISVAMVIFRDLPDRYFSDDPGLNLAAMQEVLRMFGSPGDVGYAVWFN